MGYFLKKLCRVKKANGQIISCNELFEKKPNTVENYAIWIRYQSRTGYHNAYREYRDMTMNGAVERLFKEMASRHRISYECIQIIRTVVFTPKQCKREAIMN